MMMMRASAGRSSRGSTTCPRSCAPPRAYGVENPVFAARYAGSTVHRQPACSGGSRTVAGSAPAAVGRADARALLARGLGGRDHEADPTAARRRGDACVERPQREVRAQSLGASTSPVAVGGGDAIGPVLPLSFDIRLRSAVTSVAARSSASSASPSSPSSGPTTPPSLAAKDATGVRRLAQRLDRREGVAVALLSLRARRSAIAGPSVPRTRSRAAFWSSCSERFTLRTSASREPATTSSRRWRMAETGLSGRTTVRVAARRGLLGPPLLEGGLAELGEDLLDRVGVLRPLGGRRPARGVLGRRALEGLLADRRRRGLGAQELDRCLLRALVGALELAERRVDRRCAARAPRSLSESRAARSCSIWTWSVFRRTRRSARIFLRVSCASSTMVRPCSRARSTSASPFDLAASFSRSAAARASVSSPAAVCSASATVAAERRLGLHDDARGAVLCLAEQLTRTCLGGGDHPLGLLVGALQDRSAAGAERARERLFVEDRVRGAALGVRDVLAQLGDPALGGGQLARDLLEVGADLARVESAPRGREGGLGDVARAETRRRDRGPVFHVGASLRRGAHEGRLCEGHRCGPAEPLGSPRAPGASVETATTLSPGDAADLAWP